MKFRYERKSHKIFCDDREIFVERFGRPREQGEQFVLNLRGSKIGFQTASWWGDDKTRVAEDGTKVWSIGVLLCQVRRPTRDNPSKPTKHTNVSKFPDKGVQNQALEIIAQAMLAFDGNPERSDKGNARARVEFTPELVQKIGDGEFLR